MDFFLQLSATGLLAGLAYGLIALSLAIIFKGTGILNFAQGEILMLIAYLASSIASGFGLSFVPLLLTTVPIAMLLGIAFERFLVRPMAGEPMFSIVMATMGAAVIIRGMTILIWGPAPRVFNGGLPTDFVEVGMFTLQYAQLTLLGIGCAGTLAVYFLLRYSRIGVAMRAIASNERSALLMGINVARVQSTAWAIGSGFAGAAGILIGALFALNGDLWLIGFRAFPALVLGGIDAPLGAMIGGVIVGLIENYAQAYIGQGMREIAGFVAIILVLMFRPNGLFGSKAVSRV